MQHYKFSFLSKSLAYLLFVIVCIIILIIPLISLNFTKYILLVNDIRFINSLLFGFGTATVATFISALFGIPAGFYIARNNNIGAKIIDSIFEIPLIMPPLIIGVLLLIFFNKTVPSFIFTFKGAVLVQFLISFPYTLKASQNTFKLIPSIYEQIAMTLGANPFKSFFDTTFKLSFKGILSGIIISWIRSFGEFGGTLLIGGAILGKTENVPVYIYMTMLSGDYEKGLLASFFVVVVGVIFMFILKYKIQN